MQHLYFVQVLRFIPYCPTGRGFFTGTVNENTIFDKSDRRYTVPRFTKEVMKENMGMLEYIVQWANRKNVTPVQIALAWTLAQKPWIVPIPGTNVIAHQKENALAANIEFSPAEILEFNEGLSHFQIIGERGDKLTLAPIDN
ncbi:aldo/keto reductase [Empedobacter falsenii]